MSSIVIPENVSSIRLKAFYKCSSLAEVTMLPLDANAVYIGDSAFKNIGNNAVVKISRNAVGYGNEGDMWNGMKIEFLPMEEDVPI